MRGTQQMKTLQTEEARLIKEIDALQNQLIGVRRAMKLVSGEVILENMPASEPRRKSPSPIKDAVIGLISEFRDSGLSVNEVMELSAKRGTPLDRASVSSLLSRLKRELVLTSSDGKYRIASSSTPIAPQDGSDGPKLNLVR